jgi:DNA-binding NarL/FixJ family response regulator
MRTTRQPSVLLADDHMIVVQGLQKLLEPYFEIAGSVQDGRELVAAALNIKPDVILLDISMRGLNGIDAALQIRKRLPGAKLIFLTQHADPGYVAGALRAGAHGYVLKRCAAAELVDAIYHVLQGETYVTPEMAKQLPMVNLNTAKARGELTAREREVLQLVAEGKSAKEIAAILSISPKTVSFHKANLMEKLGVHNTAGLTRYAMQRGLAGE